MMYNVHIEGIHVGATDDLRDICKESVLEIDTLIEIDESALIDEFPITGWVKEIHRVTQGITDIYLRTNPKKHGMAYP